MISKRLKQRAAAHALREQIDAAMADFHPPTFEEVIEEGKTLFNSLRVRQGRKGQADAERQLPRTRSGA